MLRGVLTCPHTSTRTARVLARRRFVSSRATLLSSLQLLHAIPTIRHSAFPCCLYTRTLRPMRNLRALLYTHCCSDN